MNTGTYLKSSCLILALCCSCCCSLFAINHGDNEVKTNIEQRLATADSLHSVGHTEEAAIMGQETIELAGNARDTLLIVASNAAQGVFLRSLGRIEEALDCYNKGLSIATSSQFRDNPGQDAIEEIATLYINLSVLNLDMQHKDDAAKNAALAGDWVAKSNDPALKSTIYGVAGSVLTGVGELEKAMEFQNKAYTNALDAGDKDATFRAAAYTMLLADRTGNRPGVVEWQKRCETLLPDITSSMTRLVYYQAQCSIALRNGNPKEALGWFDKILSLDGIDNLPFVKFDCYNNMHLAFASLGEYRDAYSTLLKSNELRDSIWEQQKAESLRDLTVKYETKETELALAQSEAKRARILVWLLAALTIIAIGVACFIAYASKQRRRRLKKEMEFTALKSETERRLTEEYIGGLENERERLARELHDGVCNDLLAIQINIRKEGLTRNTEEMILKCRESIRQISHEMLPPEFHYATLEEVIRFHVDKNSELIGDSTKITFTSESDSTAWNDIPDSMALEIYRIMQEALGNSLKYSGADNILVSLTLKDHRLNLRVADNGRFRHTDKRGVGLESIRRRAKAIGGIVKIISIPEGGTEINLSVNTEENYGNP